MQERWLPVNEIAAHLGVNSDTVYKWINRKNMPARKVGRLWKFLASEDDQWAKGGRAAHNAQQKRTTLKQPTGRTSKKQSKR